MSIIRKLATALLAAMLVTPAVAAHGTDCGITVSEDGMVVLRGRVVSSVYMNNILDGTGREALTKYLAIVPDKSLCVVSQDVGDSVGPITTGPENLISLQWPNSVGLYAQPKWLGYYVEIRAKANVPMTAHWPTNVSLYVLSIQKVN